MNRREAISTVIAGTFAAFTLNIEQPVDMSGIFVSSIDYKFEREGWKRETIILHGNSKYWSDKR